MPLEIVYASPYRYQISLGPASAVVGITVVAAAVAFPVVVALFQQWCAVEMLIVCLTPSRIGFFHLNHGVFDCTVERGCRVAIARRDGESPRGGVDCVAREHELISLLLGSDDIGMVGLSKGLAVEVSDAGFSYTGWMEHFTWPV